MEGKPKRKALRLEGYDYSKQGLYFLTVCTVDKALLFGEVVGGGVLDAPQVVLTEAGISVERQVSEINARYTHLCIEHWVIMPNHIHLLVRLERSERGPSGTPAPTGAAIPSLMSTLKRLTNRACGKNLWQRGYYDHIIRDESDWLRIRRYMDENPAKWREDSYYRKRE